MDFYKLCSVSLTTACGHRIVDELHETVKAFRRARFAFFVNRFRSVRVLMPKDPDCAGEYQALEMRETRGFKEIGDADDVHARGVNQIATLRSEQRRHEISE